MWFLDGPVERKYNVSFNKLINSFQRSFNLIYDKFIHVYSYCGQQRCSWTNWCFDIRSINKPSIHTREYNASNADRSHDSVNHILHNVARTRKWTLDDLDECIINHIVNRPIHCSTKCRNWTITNVFRKNWLLPENAQICSAFVQRLSVRILDQPGS